MGKWCPHQAFKILSLNLIHLRLSRHSLSTFWRPCVWRPVWSHRIVKPRQRMPQSRSFPHMLSNIWVTWAHFLKWPAHPTTRCLMTFLMSWLTPMGNLTPEANTRSYKPHASCDVTESQHFLLEHAGCCGRMWLDRGVAGTVVHHCHLTALPFELTLFIYLGKVSFQEEMKTTSFMCRLIWK